jgi:Ca2+-binding RTX toxin-like protein
MKGTFYDVDTSVITGGMGNDTIVALGKTRNSLYGGGGDDTMEVALSAQKATNYWYADSGTDTVTGGEATDYYYGGVIGAGVVDLGFGDDFAYGGLRASTISGNFGNDIINGSPFGDSLSGGLDNDTITGDFGDDTIYAGDGNDIITGGYGADLIHGDYGDDLIKPSQFGYWAYVRDTVFGGAGNDTITESARSISLHGGSGDDLFQTVGAANIHGDYGNDRFEIGTSGLRVQKDHINQKTNVYAGDGNDKVDVYGAPNDRISIDLGTGKDTATIWQRSDSTYTTVSGGYGSDTFIWKPISGYFQLYYSAALESNLAQGSRDQLFCTQPMSLSVGFLLEDSSFGKNAFVSHVQEGNGWGNVNFIDKNGTTMQVLVPNNVSVSWGLI